MRVVQSAEETKRLIEISRRILSGNTDVSKHGHQCAHAYQLVADCGVSLRKAAEIQEAHETTVSRRIEQFAKRFSLDNIYVKKKQARSLYCRMRRRSRSAYLSHAVSQRISAGRRRTGRPDASGI